MNAQIRALIDDGREVAIQRQPGWSTADLEGPEACKQLCASLSKSRKHASFKGLKRLYFVPLSFAVSRLTTTVREISQGSGHEPGKASHC